MLHGNTRLFVDFSLRYSWIFFGMLFELCWNFTNTGDFGQKLPVVYPHFFVYSNGSGAFFNEIPLLMHNSTHCVKSVRIRSYSGPHFSAFGLNTKRYGVHTGFHFIVILLLLVVVLCYSTNGILFLQIERL